MADVGHSLADADAQLVELGGLRPGEFADPGIGQLAQGRRRLVGLVDDAYSLGVDRERAGQEVVGGERDNHECLLRAL